MKITTIELPIYYLDLILVINEDWEVVNKKFKLELDKDFLEAHAVTTPHPEYKGKQEIYILLKPRYLDYNTITHELYHVLSHICIAKGITPDPENDEPLAYLQGYIAEKIFEFRDNYLKQNETKTTN